MWPRGDTADARGQDHDLTLPHQTLNRRNDPLRIAATYRAASSRDTVFPPDRPATAARATQFIARSSIVADVGHARNDSKPFGSVRRRQRHQVFHHPHRRGHHSQGPGPTRHRGAGMPVIDCAISRPFDERVHRTADEVVPSRLALFHRQHVPASDVLDVPPTRMRSVSEPPAIFVAGNREGASAPRSYHRDRRSILAGR